MGMDMDGEELTTRYYRDADGVLGQRAGTGVVELPDGAVELSAEEYDQADEAWTSETNAHQVKVSKAAAVTRKKAFRELTGLGLSPETAKLLLHMS